MNKLDLRQIATIMDLPIYVDVASIRDHKGKNSIFSARDEKVMMVNAMLHRAFEQSKPKECKHENVTYTTDSIICDDCGADVPIG